MKTFFNLIIVFSLVHFLIVGRTALAGAGEPERPADTKREFYSPNAEGLIGFTADVPLDNPADNIFHVTLSTPLCGDENVWLVYDLDGVEDHTAVSRSINDQVAVGGYLVKKRHGWATQRERINAEWLREGDNVIRFSMPANAQYSYRIKNLRIEVAAEEKESTAAQVIVNQPSLHYFYDKAYIKGYVAGAGSEDVRIRIAGQEARVFNGEFESVVDFASAQNSCSLEIEAVYPDGSTTCHEVSFSQPETADYEYSLDGFTSRSEKYFPEKKEETLSLDGAFLHATADALRAGTTLSITSLRAVDIPALDGGMVNVTKNHAGFRFLPHGILFTKAADVHLPFDQEKIPDGYTQQDIRTYYFDEQSHHWIALALDTVLMEKAEVVSKTLHFTDMINAIIKVPESPEVEAYNSTSMKGIKAANPTAAVNLINPPQANNTGNASLAYPLNLPAGRAGMQPQLAISYNSGEGNGWMGLGWNLSLPAISIDTRWGVPRYDPDHETETYTMNGEQLTPVAHRGVLRLRASGGAEGVRFYPRVEGAFNKIMRHGNTPADYWWEVTDKSGTRYFYGGSPAGFEEDAVLRTDEANDKGNVAQWCLREVRDLNGNTVRYHYAKMPDTGVNDTGASMGYQIYIDHITYTGFQGSDGPYSVSFLRENGRPDKMIVANLGFKQVTGDRLKKVIVKFGDKTIRSYEFDFVPGAFYKSLLSAIKEFDSSGQPFTAHTFTYYDDVQAAKGYAPLMSEETLETQSDDINGGFLNKGADFNDKASALSGTQSRTIGGGLSITVGPGSNLFSKKNSAGIGYNYSNTRSEGRVQMVDMNGDGLPDKVMVIKENRDKRMMYRPQVKGANGTTFGSLRPVHGVNEFLKEVTSSNDFGLESHFGIFAGVNYTVTKSTTATYFTDANGDGLIDIVRNGRVYYNRLDSEGDPSFYDDSNGTPNKISAGGVLDKDVFAISEEEVNQLKEQNPLQDMVRLWVAPYDGVIRIQAPVRLLEDFSEERQTYTTADGVKVSIQLKGDVLWQDAIKGNDYDEKTPDGLTNIPIQKGDKLFFRVQSVEDGAYDQVLWKPVIEYSQHNDTLRDANGKYLYRFEAKDDYLLTADEGFSFPIAGKVNIDGIFYKPQTTDSVTVAVLLHQGATNVLLYTAKFKGDTLAAVPVTKEDIIVNEGDNVEFKVTSSSNVNWPALQWRPHVYYTESYDTAYKEVRNEDGSYVISSFQSPQLSIYAETVFKSFEWQSPTTDSINVAPLLTFKDKSASGDIIFTVKSADSLRAKFLLTVQDSLLRDKLTNDYPRPKKIYVRKGDRLFFEYHTPKRLLAYATLHSQATVESDTIGKKTVEAGLHTVMNSALRIFGPLYRQWGFFSYRGNEPNADSPIDEAKLNIDDLNKEPAEIDLSQSTSEEDMEGDFDASGGHRANKSDFALMYADAGTMRWMGHDDLAFVHADTLSSSRMGIDQISSLLPELSQGGDGKGYAVDKITKSNSTALAVSAGVGGNGSTGNSRVITDFIDMNGDRYPDILGEYKIQYTLPQGGFEDKSRSHAWEFGHRTRLLSGGVTAGGNFSGSGKEAGGSPRHAKFSALGEATSFNVGAVYSDDKAQYSWMDINGDGLPDRVNVDDRKVNLNLGYSFTPAEDWGEFQLRHGSSLSASGGLGINIGHKSWEAGIGYSRSDNYVHEALQDVNGDGLVDRVVLDQEKVLDSKQVKVYFNTGNGFAPTAVVWGDINRFGKGVSTNWSANTAVTFGIPLFGVARILFNPKVNYSQGFNREKIQLSDIDGDGNPDYLFSDTDDELIVRKSTIGRTNLLKEVRRPLGARFAMTYSYIGNTYDMPNGVWALDSVTIHDGYAKDGVDSMLTTFAYEDGRYDRREREFYGFAKVITRTHDTGKAALPVYTQVAQTFANDNYYDKGLLLSEVMTDGEGNKFVQKENRYELRDIASGGKLTDAEKKSDSGNAFPALIETQQKFYEGQSDAGKSTRMTYEYSANGNVTGYTDEGDESPEDDLHAEITYHDLQDKYLVGIPEHITVTNAGTTLRERQSTIDPNTGNITQIKQYLSQDEVAIHDMEYDEYGNLKKITRPANAKGQRLSFDYEYDTQVYTYTTKVSNSYGYSSEAKYDVSFGQMLSSKDLNGNEVTYELDNVGRVISITGPYEQGGGNKTIEFEYHPEAQIPWALTRHYDPSDPQNKLETEIFVDGLGRVLQTKKDAAIFQGEGKADMEMMIVSGRVTFDAFGRTVSALYPVTEAKAQTPGAFNTTKDEVKPTLTEYDVLNRTTKVTLPDGAITETLYGFGSDRDGTQQFSTKTTDANGKQTEQFTDVRGRVTAVKNYTSEKEIWTSFKYNAINEQVEATDDLGNTTFSSYDNLGRRITRIHPDAGQTNYRYDLAGNLTQLETANLIKDGMAIEYSYDFERLTNITYPQNAENNVKYTYGEAGASDNRAGRIVLQEDASGAQEFFYGPLGEVVKNIRTIVIPQFDEQTYTTQWQYDTWNRLTSMTYADGEKVTYNYNAGGLLRSMTGKKKGTTFNYVNQLGYDKFEQRVYLEYGNGTKTTYNYEPERRRLQNMTAQTKAKRLFMDNVYTYDKVNNILSLENKAPVPASNLMGGSSTYSYDYDDLYRLTSAEGSYKGANESHTYTLSMSYNSVGGITQKTQVHKKGEQEQKKTTYDLSYTYGETQPHAPIHIGGQTFTYDANGNQTGWTSDVSGQRRVVLWDEENRIRSIYDNGSQHHYVYDAAGERVLKGKTTGQRIFVNGEWKAGSGQMGNYTVYVNPYLVLRSGSYTKHYYIEGQRIVSKLGGGWDNKNSVKAGGNKVDYVGKAQKVFDGIVKNLKFLGADGQVLTAGKSGKVPPGQISGSGNVAEPFRYFYHPDHLGSTSYVTDASGEVFQHLEYFAFGETFVEEHSNTDKTPYLFNGKELDEETGLYYYGARYYDPRTSVFQSVDPRADHFPSLTPYQFAGNRGPNAVDLDGLEPVTPQGFIPSNLLVNPAPPPPPSGWHPPMSVDYTTTTTKVEARKATVTTTKVLTGEVTDTKVINRKYDVANGKNIPSFVDTKDNKGNSKTVSISFLNTGSDNQNSNNKINPTAVEGFIATVQKANEMGGGIESLAISATTNGAHKGGWYSGSSNHYKGNAIDIGLINGMRPTTADSLIQMAADSISTINENFGPKFDHRKTKSTSDQKHTTWIHLSFQ